MFFKRNRELKSPATYAINQKLMNTLNVFISETIRCRSLVRGAAVVLSLAAGVCTSAAAESFSCNSIYAINASGVISKIDEDGTITTVSAADGTSTDLNPLGISFDGRFAYSARNTEENGRIRGKVISFDANTQSWSSDSPAPDVPVENNNMIAGAVNPANGWFYTAGSDENSATASRWYLYAYNPQTPSLGPVRVGTINGVYGNNGDMAFDSQGNLYILVGNIRNPEPNTHIYRVEEVPTQAGSESLIAYELASVKLPETSNAVDNAVGIAFTATGQLITTTRAGYLQWFNPLTGARIKTLQLQNVEFSDLGSCAAGNTITLRKNLPDGRHLDTDQFTLQITGDGLPQVSLGNSQFATTSGTLIGIQEQEVGPLLALDSVELTINEVAAGTTDFINYTQTWICIDEADNDKEIASGDSLPGTFIMPAPLPADGTSVVCTITNARFAAPSLLIEKKLPHGRILASDQFTLSIALDGTTIDSNTTVGTSNEPAAQASLMQALVGQRYTLSEQASGSTVLSNYKSRYECENFKSGGQNPSGDGSSFEVVLTEGDDLICTFINIPIPSLNLSKLAQPMSDTPVEPGDVLTYTLNVEVVNGPTQSPVVLTDQLGDGLTFVEVTSPGSFTYNPVTGTFTLPAGQPSGNYSVSYTASVDAGASVAVNNSVSGTGGGDPTDPNAPGPVCAPGACATEHPLQTAVVLSKTSSPLPGSIVKPGDLITYTVEVDVVGSPTQTDVIVTDQLGDGLTFVEVLSGIPPFVQNGNGTFTLPAGVTNDEYTLTYTARVDADASVVVNNSVSGTGGGGNPDDPATCIADTCTTEHLIDPLIALSKSAVPASGEFVKAGQELTYTLNVVVERGPTQSPVVITDQLGAGLTYGAPVTPIAPFVETAPGVFTLPTGTVDGTYSVSYTATVDEDAAISVNNSVDGTGGGYPPPDIPNPPEPSKPSCAVGACDTQHPVSPVILLSKDADPDTGTAVEPGDTLTYTVMLEVQNGPTQSEITLTDTMSTGLIFGELVGDISPFEEGVVENTYTLPAETPNGIYSFSYTATVADDAVGTVGNNVVGTGGGTPGNPGDPGYVDPTCAPQACETEHPLQFAVLLSKTSDPAPGSKVKAGATITYTIEVDVVFSATQSTVTITDELGDGLTYTGVVSGGDIFEVDDTGLPNLVFTLPANTPSGEYYISYTAEVNDDATVSVNNSVTGVGGGDPDFPGPQCDYDEDVFCSTEHPVEPNILLSKRAYPETGTQVNAGDTLTYTLQLTVTNGPTQSDVELEDWSEGLTFGGIVDQGEFEYVQEGGYFVLPAGAENGIYELSYTATVDNDARVSVNNSVAGIGGGIPGDPDPTGPVCEPDACETSHPLKPLVVTPVPLSSLPWNAMLIMLLLAFGVRKMAFKVK